nr:hypothetical protein [Reinekea marinisedimentorum]
MDSTFKNLKNAPQSASFNVYETAWQPRLQQPLQSMPQRSQPEAVQLLQPAQARLEQEAA